MPDDPAAARTTKIERPDVDRKARLRIPAKLPAKQPSGERVGNWDEVYALFDPDFAQIEAERCIQCPAAPCQKACPVGNDIPAALWLLEQGDIDGAANLFRDTSELPEMCGRLCPQERLCEGHCVVGKVAAPVAIGKLETFVTERQRTHGALPAPERAQASGKSVAIVGSGPSGIACGERLARRGHRVVIYDAWPEPGGVLLYGIPNFKQNKPAVERKFRELEALGVEVVVGTHIGRDIPFERLASDFDAVFLATGAPIGARLGIEHEEAPGVFEATAFLVRANLPAERLPPALRDPLPPMRQVVVVGGGDTSMDCVRSAARLGAERVTLVYRRTEAEMQGRAEERQHASEEGVVTLYLTTPLSVLVDEAGQTRGLRCQRMTLGEPDDTGRARPEVVEGSEFDLEADAIVIAIGYNVDPAWGEEADGVERDRWDRFVVDPETMRTSRPGIFAGGDDVNGADLVVTALAHGHLAADGIHDYLTTGEWPISAPLI
jgi:glutamate synthase (NADPH/NADH) small chain